MSNPVHALYASQRPLVHVFLVQESMRIDAMQAVCDDNSSVIDQHYALCVIFAGGGGSVRGGAGHASRHPSSVPDLLEPHWHLQVRAFGGCVLVDIH